MIEITEAEYDAMLAELNQCRAALNQATLRIASHAALKTSLTWRNRRLRMTLEDAAALISAQEVDKALP